MIFFAIVIEGQIEITKHIGNIKPIAIATLTDGATLGEMVLMDMRHDQPQQSLPSRL